MANVLTNFLVGLGFQYDKRQAKEFEGSIDTLKSKALQLGAVVGGAFGIKALTADFASSRDMLGKFAQTFGVSANDIQAWGNALATQGGSLETFMGQLEGIERLRAGLLVGNAEFIGQAGKAGIDTGPIIAARNATEAYLSLANQFQRMNTQQRLNAADALGLDPAAIRLLSQGRGNVEALLAKYREIRPVTKEMTDEAARFNRNLIEAQNNIQGVADRVSSALLPVINDVGDQINGWFSQNRQTLWQDIDKFISEGEARLKKAGGYSWTDFTFWGNIANLSNIARESSWGQRAQGAMTSVGNFLNQDSNAWGRSLGVPDWMLSTSFNTTDRLLSNATDAWGRSLGVPDWMTRPMFSDITMGVGGSLPSLTNPSTSAAAYGTVAPQQIRQPIRLENTVILDGKIIDQRVRDVMGETNNTTIDELKTNTRG